jgi:hypothetical protein
MGIINGICTFFCIIGIALASYLIYPAMYLAHFGTVQQVQANRLAPYIESMTTLHQVFLALATPFIGAILGGIVLGTIIYMILSAIWKAIFG